MYFAQTTHIKNGSLSYIRLVLETTYFQTILNSFVKHITMEIQQEAFWDCWVSDLYPSSSVLEGHNISETKRYLFSSFQRKEPILFTAHFDFLINKSLRRVWETFAGVSLTKHISTQPRNELASPSKRFNLNCEKKLIDVPATGLVPFSNKAIQFI
jgi:hypothetical protein